MESSHKITLTVSLSPDDPVLWSIFETMTEQGHPRQFHRPRAESILSKFCWNFRNVFQSGQEPDLLLSGNIVNQPISPQHLFRRQDYFYRPCQPKTTSNAICQTSTIAIDAICQTTFQAVDVERTQLIGAGDIITRQSEGQPKTASNAICQTSTTAIDAICQTTFQAVDVERTQLIGAGDIITRQSECQPKTASNAICQTSTTAIDAICQTTFQAVDVESTQLIGAGDIITRQSEVRTLQIFEKRQPPKGRKRKLGTIPISSQNQKLKVPKEDPDAGLLDVDQDPTNDRSLTLPEVPVFLEENVVINTTASGSKVCVGKGSYGSVYIGTYLPTHSTMAIKKQIEEYRFIENEAAIQLYLQSTGRIPAIYGISPEPDVSSGDESPGVTRMYMEFIKHSFTLTELLEITNVSSTNKRVLVELAKDICIGIDSIHELGILHNDIKGTNILVKRSSRTQPSPKAIFIDFGLASELDGITMSLDNRSRYPQYAPELFVGEHSSVRSDIFSIGYVLCLINEIVGSTLLGKISKACRLKNPAGRPNIVQIRKGIDTVLVSEFVT